MIFPTHQELIDAGFKIIQPGTPLPEYMGRERDNSCIFAKHLARDEYEIHAVKSSSGQAYGTIDLNCTDEFDHIESLDQLIAFLSQDKSRRVA